MPQVVKGARAPGMETQRKGGEEGREDLLSCCPAQGHCVLGAPGRAGSTAGFHGRGLSFGVRA